MRVFRVPPANAPAAMSTGRLTPYASLQEADYPALAKRILDGETILYPTETTYGLGCDARSEAGIRKIFELKRRPEEKSLLCLVRDIPTLETFAEIPARLLPFIGKYWPGPLTLIVPAKPGKLPLEILSAGQSDIAVRISSHPFCRKLLAHLPAPLVSTSANFSGEKAPSSFEAVPAPIREKVGIAIDAGSIAGGGIPSTIVKIDARTGKPVLVREGAVPAKALGLG
ncbi:MAG: L-threonylcarbamoyladenylate synthase [Bdellovibrionota bacterium]